MCGIHQFHVNLGLDEEILSHYLNSIIYDSSCGVSSRVESKEKRLSHSRAVVFRIDLTRLDLTWIEMNETSDGEDNSVHDDYIIAVCCVLCMLKQLCCHHPAFCPAAAAATPVVTSHTTLLMSSAACCFHLHFLCAVIDCDTNRLSSDNTFVIWAQPAEQVRPTEFCKRSANEMVEQNNKTKTFHFKQTRIHVSENIYETNYTTINDEATSLTLMNFMVMAMIIDQ